MYQISEIMGPTIQGEGLHAGRPCVFLRFSGCNLWRDKDTPSVTCPWCDTPQLHNSKEMTLEEIVTEAMSLPQSDCGLVITGGEPFLQLDTELLKKLSNIFQWVDIETNGSVKSKIDSQENLWAHNGGNVYISCSPKLPLLKQVVVLPHWWKILIPAKKNLLHELIAMRVVNPAAIYLQPVEPLDEGQDMTSPTYSTNIKECLDLSFALGVNVSLQLHKYLRLP